jgi:plastocyanin
MKIVAIFIIILILGLTGVWVWNRYTNRYTSTSLSNTPQVNTPLPTDFTASEDEDEDESIYDPTVRQIKEVEIEKDEYKPNPVRIKVGTRVIWTNDEQEKHSATADNGLFDTGELEFEEQNSVVFDKAGTFTYHDSFDSKLKGTVIVEK